MRTFNPIPRFEVHPFFLSYGREESAVYLFHLDIFELGHRFSGGSLLKVYYCEEDIAQCEPDETLGISCCLLFFHFTIKLSTQKIERFKEQYTRYEESQK